MSQEIEHKLRLGISIGDLNGIGIEVVIKALLDNRITQNITPVIYGSTKAISFYRKLLSLNDFNFITIKNSNEIISKKVNLINCWDEEVNIEPGKANLELGKYAYKSLSTATEDLKNNKLDILVTAPIDKHNIQSESFQFAGHTEYLAKMFDANEHLMFLVSNELKIALVTEHIPITKVAETITKEKINSKLQLMNHSLKRDFGIRKPRIAVLGLNPHAGDQGVIGKEDQDIIAPAVKDCYEKGMLVYGPYPADGIFASGSYTKFDAILAMYHDQGLIPFKTIAFEQGVNFTAGLPVVRTSPDHGTAYDIAGKGSADEQSFRSAIYMAYDIFYKRREFDAVNANPLAFTKLSGDR